MRDTVLRLGDSGSVGRAKLIKRRVNRNGRRKGGVDGPSPADVHPLQLWRRLVGVARRIVGDEPLNLVLVFLLMYARL